MIAYLDAFVPAFGLLALGALLKRRLLREDAIWAGIERLIFWVLLPALLVAAIGSVKLGEVPVFGMMVAIWTALGIGTAASLLIARSFRQPHASMTSVLMGGIRFNNLIGFAVAGALFGAPGIALGAVATGLIVPFVQFVTNTAFAAGGGRRFQPWPVLRQILLNPLMLACVVGFAVAWAGGLPPGLKPLLESLGRASVALGLLAVGAALSLGAMADRLPLQLVTSALKLIIMPGLTLAFCLWLGLEPLSIAMAVLFMALPTAATSYVMARAMGGDAPLMAAITSTEHALAIISLPLWLLLVKHMTGLG
ncbi:AEC family transporter [Roseococcus sp. SDR]|uniref:AEC family transporter n=1 Tax=Roseococcus sp. SDR TaxID=2835532 RepID=UPI001BD1B9EA|nr:AEC family transporter [Roseococcus sp. SDR]MBS7790748.1 AEC family transporter [Roseococcus sp. SDR]MBV1846062.1 AEC family transporter [Roseococcus sp. SDR]